jgi:hypothetical protein
VAVVADLVSCFISLQKEKEKFSALVGNAFAGGV